MRIQAGSRNEFRFIDFGFSPLSCSPKTYYRWEQEILGKVRQIAKAQSQPVLAELPMAKPVQDCSLKRDVFVPAAVIRIGQMELELSNTVSAELLSHLKGLMRLVE